MYIPTDGVLGDDVAVSADQVSGARLIRICTLFGYQGFSYHSCLLLTAVGMGVDRMGYRIWISEIAVCKGRSPVLTCVI